MKTPEICLTAVQYNGNALRFIPDSLKTPELCLEALEAVQGYKSYQFYISGTLRYIPDNLKTIEVCLEAVFIRRITLYYDMFLML